MNKKDIIDAIVIALVLIILFTYNLFLKSENSVKNSQINELQNTIEKQIELIDALQQ